MNLTNRRQEEDKQNINSQNICISGAGKKKIEKKSIVKRYTSGKTAEAIKRLTLDLKLRLAKQKSPYLVAYPVENNFSHAQTIQLSGFNNKKCEFLCYNDESAVAQEVTSKNQQDINSCGEQLGYRKLLKKHTTDHDIESDDQHLKLCVQYMKACLSDAGQNRTNILNQESGVGLRRIYQNAQ